MSCEIIQFAAAARPVRKVIGIAALTPRQQRREGRLALPPPATETAKNARIRIARRDVWRHAGWTSAYWRARLDWQAALETAQRHEIVDSASLPPLGKESRFDLVDKWREAVVKQLLTPAPDLAAITWKRAKLKSSEFPHLPVKKERVEQAIADDLTFLAAHPTRRSNSEAMAKSREFKEAMRQRIRKLAAERDLPDEEIKRVLRLRHHEIAAFAIKHSVSLAWLLEGAGPVFEKYDEPEQ